MPDDFNPYRVLLDISPNQQPPNDYRLLGVRDFEDDLHRIQLAIDKRKARLATFLNGRHAAPAKRLLGEVAAAGSRLLNPQQKAAYDQELRHPLDSLPTRASVSPPPVEAVHASDTATKTHCIEQLGDYQLLEKLGEGGMGTVYKARHINLDRLVALKVLSKDRMQSEQAVARFEREMKAVGCVDHPNVVRALDARKIEGDRLLVMELVEGLDLAQLVAKAGPLGVADACEIIRQAALGLQAAHEKGLVHRDIKPPNLMLTPQGQVKVLDLGLARFQYDQSPDDDITTGGHVFGTVAYMAPEQATDSHSVDIRADIYGLGCTLYKLLTGRAPYGKPKYTSSIDILTGHARDPIPPICDVRNDVPAAVVRILDRMLAKKPQKRFSTPVEVADALGPLCATAELASLLTNTQGKPSAAVDQALAVTQSPPASTSSALTRMFDQIKGDKEPSPVAHASNVSRKRLPMPLLIGLGVVAVALTAVAVAWFGFSRGPAQDKRPEGLASEETRLTTPATGPVIAAPSQTQLVLQWPEGDRADAKLEIDGKEVDLAAATVETTPQEVVLSLRPGQHSLWIGRRGAQPYSQQLALAEGERLEVTPEWVPQLAEPDMAESSPDEPAEEPAVVEVVPPELPDEPKEDPAAVQARLRLAEYEATEAAWREATSAAEQLASVWDFSGAMAALEAVALDDEPLVSRLVGRRDELKRLADLKARIITFVNASQPRLRKSDLLLRGQGGEVTGADDLGLSSTTVGGKTESHAWGTLSDEAASKLMQRVVDLANGDDLLASGLLALVAGDPARSEKCFAAAASQGFDIGPYQATLATAALARAKQLLDAGEYTQAGAALASIETTYSAIPWFAIHQPVLDAAASQAKSGIFEAEAETLYTQAAQFLADGKLFDLKPVVETLETDYTVSVAATDLQREPSFVDLQEAIADLGQFLTVRQDGEGDFTTIQAAIDAAPPKSIVQVEDSGPYYETVRISPEKVGLTLRGKTGCWPIITSLGQGIDFATTLVSVEAKDVTIEQVILLHTAPPDQNLRCLDVSQGPFHLRSTIVYMESSPVALTMPDGTLRDCLIFAQAALHKAVCSNCLMLGSITMGGSRWPEPASPEFRFCTITRSLASYDPSLVAVDCIVSCCTINYSTESGRIEHCNVFSSTPFEGSARPGKGTFSLPPQFRDPANLDYRLMPTSPCIGRASDGGNIGVRYTPVMIEMCTQALKLRADGIIKFQSAVP